MSERQIQPSSIQYVADNGNVTITSDYGVAIVGTGTAQAQDYGTAIAGMGNAVVRNHSVASMRGGNGNSATGVASSVAVAWELGHASVANGGVALAGLEPVKVDESADSRMSPSAAAGDSGVAYVRYNQGAATANNHGIAITGDGGTASAGAGDDAAHQWSCGIAIAGADGKAKAGPDGVIIIRDKRQVPHAGHIGQNGLEPGKWYRWDEAKGFVETVP